MYEKPKKDPRSKLHIQSGDQTKNLDFILEKLSLFYSEVCEMVENALGEIDYKEMHKCLCGKCGKTFTNKRGLKQHIMRMHTSKGQKTKNINKCKDPVTLEEEVTNGAGIEELSLNIGDSKRIIEVAAVSKPAVKMSNNSDMRPRLSHISAPIPLSRKPITVKSPDSASESEDDNMDFIKDMVNDLVDQCDLVGTNYQCGVCGETFDKEKDTNTHIPGMTN